MVRHLFITHLIEYVNILTTIADKYIIVQVAMYRTCIYFMQLNINYNLLVRLLLFYCREMPFLDQLKVCTSTERIKLINKKVC